MPIVMTAAPTLGDLVKHDANPEYTREIVTLKSGQEYPAGAVLGKITASGHYTLAPATETAGLEGAEVACAVLLENVDATTAEADGLVLARGMSIVAENALTMDASVDTALERELKNQQLAAYGIVVRQG